MSEQVTVGEFTLEISGDQIVVRDATGGIVETVDVDDLNGELILPSGERVDVAALMADAGIANLQTAAGGLPGGDSTTGYTNSGPGAFHAFRSDDAGYTARGSAGALGNTSLDYSTPESSGAQFYTPQQQEQSIVVTWAAHEPWVIEENQPGGVFGKVVDGNPADYTFAVSDSRFEVVDGVLRVRNGYTFNFEHEPGIDLEITATSRTGDVQTLNTHIDVADVNEEQTALTLDNASVDENAAGAVIGNLNVVDPDASDSQSFTVSDDRFEIVNGQLKLKDGTSLDHEGKGSVDVTVTATDSAGHAISQTFAIQVGDVNEQPTDIDLSANSLVENVAGAVVGTLTAIDPDAGDTHTFAVSDPRFEVVDGALKLKDGVSLDFEAEPTLNVIVTATDAGGKSVQETFTLSVEGANEAQTGLAIDNTTIVENAAGAVVGNLTVMDPDAGDSQSFAVSDSRFEVANGQLKLKDGISLNFEAETSVSVTVTATDQGGHEISKTFTVGVTDVNEAQTSMTLSKNTVAENAKGAVIGAVSVVDPDAGDKQTFTVSDSRFQVVNGQLKLKSGVSINYESEPSVDVKVTATDKAGHQIAETFHINVTDVNEKQTAITLTGNTVLENAAGAIIGKVGVSDPDAGDVQTFKVSDSRFEVVNGDLKLKDGVSLNYESAAVVNVRVTATDSANHSIAKTFAINVGDVNEAQTNMTLTGSKVTENESGAVVGTLKVTDPDKVDVQSYSVSDDRFEVVNGTLKLKDGVSLDYEAGSTVSVDVTATDMGGHQITKSYSVTVGNVWEAQTDMTLSANSVKENAAGAVIGKLSVVDPDAGDTQTYTVSDDRFQVVNGQLKLKAGVSFDYETTAPIDLDVTATDKGGNQITKSFTINVTDVNEAQTAITLTGNTVAENDAGAIIGTVGVSDPDAGDVQTFKVSDSRFEVVNGDLKLKDGVSLNYESAAVVNVTVTATDSANHSISKAFAINVGDVNEAQTNMTLTGTKVSENAAGAVVGTIAVTDPDAGDAQSFSVSDTRFEVVNGQLKLKDGVSLDYEAASKVSLDVTATDTAGHQITKTFAVSVTNVWEAQTDMTLSANAVKENAAGATIGTLKVIDPDAGDAQTYTVSDDRFEVVSSKLKLKAGVSLDYEAASTIAVDVTATDKGGNQITKSYTINVGDVNEAQTAITIDNMSIAENSKGAIVGNLSVADPDAGDVQTFKVSDSRFEVVNGQLKVKAGISFDHETTDHVDVTVTATDKAKHSFSQTFAVSIADVNEAQTGMALVGKQVAENAPGAVIGIVSVTDPDVGDMQSFQVSDTRFEVVNGQLKLKDGVSLDHEAEGSVSVTITATDKGGNQIAQTYQIQVDDANDAQTAMSIDTSHVAENAAGAVVGKITVVDQDAGDSQSFQVSDPRFEVVNGELKLKDGVSLDHESEGSVTVTVTATDKGGHQIAQDFKISVDDQNEAQTGMILGNSQVTENDAGAVVGTITVSDPDAGDTQSFKVSDPRFEVVGGELKLKDGVSLDHESEATVSVTVTATDGASHQYAKTFTITVGDVNEAQTGMTLSASNVAENAAGAVVGTLSVSDADAGDSQGFQVSDPRFEVVNGQLKLKDGVSLDHESEGNIDVTVTATDGGNHQYSKTFAITVGDVNEAQTALTLGNSTVSENAAGAVVGTLTVTDPDAGDAQSFQVSDARFEVVNGALKLKDGVSLDHETEGSVTVTVKATDAGGHEIAQDFKITVSDVNEAQTGMTLSASSVAENAAGATIGTLSVSDPDAGDSQSFQVSDSRFEVVNGALKLKDGQSLDHESEGSVDVTVTATDNGAHQYSKTFTITVGDVNEAQTSLTLGNSTVLENSAGAVVGAITVTDPDAGDTQSFQVSDSRFEVVNGQLKLKDGQSLDHESEGSVNVTVKATDAGGHEISQAFKITVGDVNEAQTGMALSGSSIAENAKGAVVGTLTVSDPDAGDSQSFQVSDNRFEVVNGQLKLKDGQSLDHESEGSVNVTVTATDNGNHQYSKTFTIAVSDVNEVQTGMTLSASKVAENASGATVGILTTSDPDAGDMQSYTVSDSRFEVVNDTLKLKAGQSLNYETEPSVSVTVTAKDTGGNTYSKAFTIGVTDVNEAQTGMTLSASKVAENSSGATIGTLTTTDPDAGDTQSYTVSDSRFEVVNDTLKLKAGQSLNYETEPSVNVTVTAKDTGGNTYSKTFTVGVTDVNEVQTGMSLSASKVAENASGATIGTLTTTDPDAGDTQTYTVSDSRFEVVNNTLKLKAGQSLNYEAEPSVDVTVTAKDTGNNTYSKTFTIAVTDVNEAQTGMSLSANKVAENASGATIGTLSVTDPDAGDTQSYTVSDSRFEVVNNTLKLKSGQSLDYETSPSVSVDVTAKDMGGNTITKTFSIAVSDVNEVQTGMSISNSKVAENASGANIGTLTTTDPDAGDTQTYTVSDSRFEVVNNVLKLKAGQSLNYEAEPSVNVTVTAKDTGGNSYSKAFTIGVTDVNEAQTGMSISNSKVAENASGATIGTLTTTDPDAGDTQTYTVSDSRFEVVNNALKLKSGQSLNYETEPSVNVTVTAKDSGGNTYAKAFTIAVTDVNEAQTGMSLSANKVAENAAGATIGTLTTTDPDTNDTQTYTVSDSRFEVVNSALKLKAGVSINYEAEPSVNVTVTAKDTGGNSYSKAFTIGVTDVNEVQTGMSLSASKVAENSAGATIGTLTTTDPDANDSQTYTVSDSRFEVVNSALKLKSGVSLDYEAGSTINLTVTATDKGANQYTKAFTVTVTDVNEIAPVVVAKDGSSQVHVYDTLTTYTPTASATVGAYLYSNDSAGVKTPAASELTSIDSANMTLKMETEVQVTFQKEAAGNRNMVGTYQYDDSGKIIPGSVKFVWLDASANNEGVLGSAMSKDTLGYAQSNTVSLGTMAAGTHVGFFTISNGASDSTNKSLLSTAAAGTTTQAAAMDAIASQMSIKIDANGNGNVYIGNTQMNGAVFFTHDKTLNTDFNGTSDIVHMTSGVSSSMPNQLMIGVEDLAGGGDKDFNDVVFSVNLGSYDTNKVVSNTVQPSVDFSDADSTTLTQATIQTSGFQSGDVLTIPTSSLFTVSVTHTTAEYTITITGKSGSETIDQYENFVNSISFSTTSKVEGDRHIDYSVTDNGGLKSTVDRADISVDSDYHVSTSELASGKTTFTDSADHLYINTSSFNQVDMGAGHDTVHLAQQDRGFDHNDAVKLSNVEALDTTGYGVNKVSLSITDVLNMTDADNHLTVIGDKGDVVTLDSTGGSGKWEVTGSDAQFTTYHYTDSSHEAIVQISNQLTANIG